jgi:hypothetical protein
MQPLPLKPLLLFLHLLLLLLLMILLFLVSILLLLLQAEGMCPLEWLKGWCLMTMLAGGLDLPQAAAMAAAGCAEPRLQDFGRETGL